MMYPLYLNITSGPLKVLNTPLILIRSRENEDLTCDYVNSTVFLYV